MQRRAGASVLAATLALAVPTVQQAPEKPPAALSGVAVDGTTGAPVAGAVAWLRQVSTGGVMLRQYTDNQGRFVFMGLQPDAPTMLTVEKAGYQTGSYAQRFPGDGSSDIRLDAGQWLRDVTLKLWRPSAIEGTVLDEHQEPIVNALVRALREFSIGGTTRYLPGPWVRTDDRGAYRLGRLSAGRYAVAVNSQTLSAPTAVLGRAPFQDALLNPVPNMPIDRETSVLLGSLAKAPRQDATGWWSYSTTFYPATPVLAQASVLELGESETRSGVDVRLEPVRAFRVSGVVSAPPAALVDLNVRLILAGNEGLGIGSEVATARVAADGRFELVGVPSGAYTLDATRRVTEFRAGGMMGAFSAMPSLPVTHVGGRLAQVEVGPPGTVLLTSTSLPEDVNWSGRATLSVTDHDVTDVAVPLGAGGHIGGRVVWEHVDGGLIARTLYFDSRDFGGEVESFPVEPAASGAFGLEGLRPGHYTFGHSDAGTIKSVQWRGEDRTTRGFDLDAGSVINDVVMTLTDNGGSVSGTVTTGSGAAGRAAAVICFPAQADEWRDFGLHPRRLGAVLADPAGHYDVASLPEGDYFFVAVPTADRERWQDPAFLAAAAPSATRVTLHWGDRLHQDLALHQIGAAR
jgi:hypothetical protein